MLGGVSASLTCGGEKNIAYNFRNAFDKQNIRYVTVAKKVWQPSGTIATGVTVARGSSDLWKMWQTSGSGRPFLKNRGMQHAAC